MEENFNKEFVEVLEDNNKLLFKPEFIPFYLEEVEKYCFNKTEGLLYGFIRFYLKNNPNGKFYFTNEQLSKILNVSEQTVSNSLAKVCDCGEFKVSYKIKANGGTFRLIENNKSDYKKSNSPTIRNLIANKNKINKNKINISNDIGKKPNSYGNEDINTCISYLKEKIDAELDGSDKENRRYCYNLLRKLKKQYPDTEAIDNMKLLIDIGLQDRFHRKNITSFKYLFYNAQRIIQSYKSDYGIGEANSDIQVIS